MDDSKLSTSSGKNILSDEVVNEIKSKLKTFEEQKGFLEPNLTIPIVAKMIGSNRSHISYVLNDHFHISFSTYLKVLRINYVTNLFLEDNKYLNYKLESLAEMCGMANRQVFSANFLGINGIRPTDFIRKRKEELGIS